MKYWIDFSGYLKIEADSKEEAERKMWEWINSHDLTGDFSDDVWDIDCIEEAVEGPLLEPVYGNNPPTQEELEAFWHEH